MEKKQLRYREVITRVKRDNLSANNNELSRLIADEIKKAMPADEGELLEPMNTTNKITDKIRAQAGDISNRKKGLLVQFVRAKKPELISAAINLQTGKIAKVYSKSPPIGALVAFADGPDILFGWSKYNFAKDENGVQLEKEPFTKKDATLIAIMRALTDGVKGSGNGYFVTNSDVIIPKVIDKETGSFVARTLAYFNGQLKNVSFI